jgi:hypothetical protein
MKKVMFKSLLMAAVFSGLIFTSCKKSDSGGNTTNPNDPSNVATKNLVAYFPFDGNGNEKITGLTPTTTTSKVKFVTGQKGQAYQGDTLAYMLYTLPSSSKLMNMHAFTVSLWLKSPKIPNAVPPVPTFFQLNGTSDPVWGNFSFGQERSDADSLNLHFQFYKDNVSWNHQHIVYSNPNFPASTWMYLTFSYDSAASKFNIYVKGQKLYLKPDTTNRYDNDPKSGGQSLGNLSFTGVTQACIGTWWDLATGGATVQAQNAWMGYFKGEMDELRIYNKALTDAEVLTLYQDEVATLNP